MRALLSITSKRGSSDFIKKVSVKHSASLSLIFSAESHSFPDVTSWKSSATRKIFYSGELNLAPEERMSAKDHWNNSVKTGPKKLDPKNRQHPM